MLELYLSELRRFRRSAVFAALGHLVLLFLILRFKDFMQAHANTQSMLLAIYLLLSFGFGLYQFGSYRQPNRWAWLMHRPLPAWKIATAICGASATLILGVIGLPALVALGGTQLLTTRVADLHFYAVALHATLFAIAAWLCAGYVMLNRSKLAASIIVLPFLLMFHISSVYKLLGFDVLCLVLLLAMVTAAMKPNRHAPPEGTAAVLSIAVPLHLASYLVVLWVGNLAFQYATIIADTHPLNTETPPAGGYTEAVRSTSADSMLAGLAASTHPQAGAWRALAENTRLRYVYLDHYPVRNQVAPMSQTMFEDPENKLRWTYSQDAGAFIGRSIHTGERKASMPVPSLPHLKQLDAQTILAVFPHHIDRYDPSTKAWRPMLRVREDEILLGAPKTTDAEREYIVTSKRVIIMEGSEVRREVASVPLPGPAMDLSRVDVLPVQGGTLVSFAFGKLMIDGFAGGDQIVMHLDAAGQATEVARRALTHDFPLLFEHKDWWLSPVLYAVKSLPAQALGDNAVFPLNPMMLPRPWQAWAAAAATSLLATLLGWYWLRRTGASPFRRKAWLVACLAFGPSAFLCLAVMEARKPRLAAAVLIQPAASAA